MVCGGLINKIFHTRSDELRFPNRLAFHMHGAKLIKIKFYVISLLLTAKAIFRIVSHPLKVAARYSLSNTSLEKIACSGNQSLSPTFRRVLRYSSCRFREIPSTTASVLMSWQFSCLSESDSGIIYWMKVYPLLVLRNSPIFSFLHKSRILKFILRNLGPVSSII